MSVLSALVVAQVAVSLQTVGPVLAFPEPGLDDSAAYEGYSTRFLRDAAGNTIQIYHNQREGRVVHLWADAANASAGMTVRAPSGAPARLDWASTGASIGRAGSTRVVEYDVVTNGPVVIGAFVLGSMRLERDFQYARGHLEPFGTAEATQPELLGLIDRLERLPQPEQQRQLQLLRARSTDELRTRLRPSVRRISGADGRVRIEQPTFDGQNVLALELAFDDAEVTVDTLLHTVFVRPRDGQPVRMRVRITSDAATLTPLDPDRIFNRGFLRFHERVRGMADSTPAAAARARRLERQMASLQLAGSEEKLMAGLPNYATYFGRDMLMSALMLEPIWTSDMIEQVLASVLRKLSPAGDVSHEEALGGQAIRENAAVYNAVFDAHASALEAGQSAGADRLLDSARTVLGRLQAVRENFHMVDDDFQLPVLAARYLTDEAISPDRKRAFLLTNDHADSGPRLGRLLRNLAFVARAAAPYARASVADSLISFARRDDGRWSPGSWRDSGAGYGNGRFAMDVNVIWVPHALAAMDGILSALEALGFSADGLATYASGDELDPVLQHAQDRAGLRAAIAAWQGARAHFEVSLTLADARSHAREALAELTGHERSFWQARLDAIETDRTSLEFLAVALDSAGRPIPVMSTDPATQLFLEDPAVLAARADETLREIETLLVEYPLGLLVPELGPLVANDVYAAPAVRAAFREDLYHSPRVVWGREVNLLLLGLARNIAAAHETDGRLRDPSLRPYVDGLRDALARASAAVDASGLKHNELWSYRIDDDGLHPIRYGASTDIQLWNLTDLAVQYALDQLPPP